MKQSRVVVALSVAAIAGVTSQASANTNYYQPGAMCTQVLPETGNPTVDSNGTMQNDSATDRLPLVCPISQIESSTVDMELFRIYYYENNTGIDVDDRFQCTVSMTTDTGSVAVVGYRYSCLTAGGCSTVDSDDNPGYNYLSFTNPFTSTAGIVYAGAYCLLCEASPGQCQILGYRAELVGS